MLHTHREIERAAIERVSSGFKAGLIAKDSLINAVERKARYAFVIFLSSHNSIRVIFLALDFSNRAPLCFLFFFRAVCRNRQSLEKATSNNLR